MKGKDVILGLLLKKERTGYDINDIFQTIFTHFFDGSFGMIYPTLRTLEKEGKIEKKVIVQEGRPNKNEFSITELGKEEFFSYMKSPVMPESRRSDFLMRMYYGEYLEQSRLVEIIKKEIEEKKSLIHQLESDYQKWKGNLTDTQQISFDIGIAQYTAEIEVLQKQLKRLERKNEK
ncbi:PadR family transcriptional regulator [Listeria kieliensis]|uniref:PadR family transcriptional regulator n=1 Tax=Listeria kieliensis TaxID=1621700 RepID=A0A3D8TQU4_9LIST|nr:PadR family transcriptional regulator [Listeria kieliensis]RDX00759.1 PadR family transcriptional regulator [Listeria kieliensis]